jgi:hypothetical protein
MARVDRRKHDFDVLEHVLRGVHASIECELDRNQSPVPEALDEGDAPELRIIVRLHEGDPDEP